MTILIESKKERISYGGVWPTKERHQVRHYDLAGAPGYRVVLDRMYTGDKKWLYSCTVERNIGNVVESFVLRIVGNSHWGGNRPWEFAEGQIGYYVAQYLKEKERERLCPTENQQTKS